MAPVFSALLSRKLNSIGDLCKEDEEVLRSLSGTTHELAPGDPVVREGATIRTV